MRYNRLLIEGPRIDNSFIDLANKDHRINGVVVGEPFCTFRSDFNEGHLIEIMKRARKAGLYVSYQTPVYVTEGNFAAEAALAEHLAKAALIDDVQVQEVGMLNRLSASMPEAVTITWSIYGYQREFPGMDIPMNQELIDFLVCRGVNLFEITAAVAFSIMKNKLPLEFRKRVYYHKYDPISFSRWCYVETLLKRDCREEGKSKLCDNRYFMVDEEKEGLEYIIEGHRIMENPDPNEFRELMKSDLEIDTLIVAGNSVDEIREQMRAL